MLLIKNERPVRNLLLFLGLLYLSLGIENCCAQGKSDEIKALVKERRDLLSDAATEMAQLYLRGRIVTLQEWFQAERDSLKADLDWYDRPEDRIKAIEKHKEVADMLLKIATGQVESARASRYVLSQARAYVCEVQIELLKQRRNAKPGGQGNRPGKEKRTGPSFKQVKASRMEKHPKPFSCLEDLNNLEARCIHDDATGQLSARLGANNGPLLPLLTDYQRRVQFVTEDSGTIDDRTIRNALGGITGAQTLTNRGWYAFKGGIVDRAAVLQVNRARRYDSTPGQWISHDPLTFRAGNSGLYRHLINVVQDATGATGLSDLVPHADVPQGPTGTKDEPKTMQFVPLAKELPVSVSISDMNLRIVSNEGKKTSKVINLRHGNRSFPAKFPVEKGYDLTEYRNQTVNTAASVTITNNGKEPVHFSLLLYFGRKLEIARIDNFVGFKEKKPRNVTMSAGQVVKFFLRDSETAVESGEPVDGRYNCYAVLSITANNLKVGKEFHFFPVFVTVAAPWYVRAARAK